MINIMLGRHRGERTFRQVHRRRVTFPVGYDQPEPDTRRYRAPASPKGVDTISWTE